MFYFFEVGRNDPCECGSGRKYKRCCKGRVDEYVRRWRGRWDWVEPPLLDALSLACGLRPDEDDRPPDPGKVEEALDALSKVWGAESEDGFVAGLLPRLETLATLLRTRDMLSDGMFGVHELWKALRALNELDEEASPATAEREFERLMEEFLPALVDRERAEEMAWALLFLLRGEEWTASELESIILGLHFCLEEKAVFNPLWETVFRVCIYEAAAALNDMQQLTEEGKTLDVEAVEDFLDRHPIMEREWSRVVRERTSRAVIAILKRAIPLDVPPYAVAGALLGIAAHIRDLAEVKDGRRPYRAVMEEVTGGEGHLGELMSVVFNQGLDLDFDIFVACVTERLYGWLDGEGRDAGGELREAVQSMINSLDSGLLSAEREMLRLLYLQAVTVLTGRPAMKLLPAGAQPAMVFDWRNPESLEAYVAYLEGAGKSEAAAHVRAAGAEFGFKLGVRHLT